MEARRRGDPHRPRVPILSRLDPARRQRQTREPSQLTVNVDYLLLLTKGSEHRWVFLELKTDPGSFDSAQLRLYRIAQRLGMKKLLADLAPLTKRSKSPHKYEHLLRKMDRVGHLEAPVPDCLPLPGAQGRLPGQGRQPRPPQNDLLDVRRVPEDAPEETRGALEGPPAADATVGRRATSVPWLG